MLNRPSVSDTDDDLLRQQEEFLKENKLTGLPKTEQKVEQQQQTANSKLGLVGNIVERKHDDVTFKSLQKTDSGFPQVFKVTKKHEKTKGSLFSQRFLQRTEPQINATVSLGKEDNIAISHPDVHQENLVKLKSMTHEEILAEKTKLEQSLDPKLLEFLKKRHKPGKAVADIPREPEPVKMEVEASAVSENVARLIKNEWLEMDTIEPEKLQWIGDIPDAKALEKDQPYSARFDFMGDLQPFKTNIDVRTSLHHHGDEPSRPGYTIQELYQLARSSVLQQRVLALNTLANIIRKTKMGYYDACFDNALLLKLVESDVFFLLRFAVDDRAITSAAIHCLHEFFVCRSDEVCLDRLLNVTDDDVEPYLYVNIELDKDTKESELKDHQLLSQDIIRGVLRTDLLVRFRYVLSEFAPDRIAVGRIFETIIRICRHSPDACAEVFNTPGLMPLVFYDVNSKEPLPQAIKLIRVLVSSSIAIAQDLVKSFCFDFMLNVIDMDAPAFKLKLESIALWKMLIVKRIFLDKFESFTPCLIRLLRFYVEKVDSNHGQFDFELFAGIVSLVNTIILSKQAVDLENFTIIIQICVEKWLSQLIYRNEWNYSLCKALGCAFRFFDLKYSLHSVHNVDVVFIRKLSPILITFLRSTTFSDMSSALTASSHIVHAVVPDRDPNNLPSLCSIYHNGSDYLKLVQNNSPLPFFLSFVKFLLKMYEISHDTLQILHAFAVVVKDPCEFILNHAPMSSWFAKYEVKFLALACAVLKHYDEQLALSLAFKVVPQFRRDDPSVVHALLTIFGSDSFPDFTEIYVVSLCNVFVYPLYLCDNISTEWLLTPIQEKPVQVLQFFCKILERCPNLLSSASPTKIYYSLCLIFLDEDNVFDSNIKPNLMTAFKFVLTQFQNLDLNIRVTAEKSFYELYIDLITQYAAISYGDHLFAMFVTLPLAQKFDISFRKLLWSEYIHALRVISLPANPENFIPLDIFASPTEMDESLLVVYLNAVSKGVLMPKRNGLIYSVAVVNVRNYLRLTSKDERLATLLRKRIEVLTDDGLKTELLLR